ncbi:MAG: GNAT family N-acetyltransferase [Litoreibacter sp.]|nr:GNAT family N-acetyltransferase [Litoreibacter sp.]
MTIEVETPICRRQCILEDPTVGIQMIAKQPEPPKNTLAVRDLSDAHATQVLDLAERCKPGPFRSQTHRLGDFIGVFRDERLVAMAGQRLKLPGFTEISAVCVEPEYRGSGFGAELVRCMSERIPDSGNVPFLHVYASNTSAIALYERLGFEARVQVQATNWIRNAAVQHD